jgi:peptide-methionine (S)-S-oxide reductase
LCEILIKTIYLAGGCFWCTEAVFQRIKGVTSVIPGYIDGFIKNPAYREVSSERTGHTEAISVDFDSERISLVELLLIFFNTHDPTTLNRQQNDKGTQYRSGIYYTHPEQKIVIDAVIKQLEEAQVYEDPIVTEVKPSSTFYKSEKEHLNYYNLNKNQPYCTYIIDPKIEKLKKYFTNFIKS